MFFIQLITAYDCLQYSPRERQFRKSTRDSIKFLRQYGERLIAKRISAITQGDPVPEDILTFLIKCKGIH